MASRIRPPALGGAQTGEIPLELVEGGGEGLRHRAARARRG